MSHVRATHPPPNESAGPVAGWPGTGRATHGGPRATVDDGFSETLPPGTAERVERASRWIGWRLRLLVGTALIGCIGIFLLARWLADAPAIGANWRATAQGQIELLSASDTQLRKFVGQTLVQVQSGPLTATPDALVLQRSPRWMIGDEARQQQHAQHQRLLSLLGHEELTLSFSGGGRADVAPQRRGFADLGGLFWLLAAFALTLYLVAMVVVLARPSARNLLYAVMSLCQSGNLVFMAIESTLDLALPVPIGTLDMPLRVALDLITGAAVVHAACVHPKRLPHGGAIAAAAWGAAAVLVAAVAGGSLPETWWVTQAAVLALGGLTVGLMSWSYRLEPHPYAMVLRRFGIVTVSSWALLTAAVALIDRAQPAQALQHNIPAIGSLIWYVFFASLLLTVPFLARSQQIMREFALLAAVSTVATSLDLLFVAAFSFGQFASLTLALFLSLGVYAGARQWIVNQLLGNSLVTTERMFEQLYRIAREVEAHPDRTPGVLAQLLRELFEPLEVTMTGPQGGTTRIVGDGATMILPVPHLAGPAPAGDEAGGPGAIVLRFAHRGRRLFTSEDARLADRIIEQLRRAVAFDKAVEQGRSEERARIAQDLHDDIGARLLTLMYKAHSPEMEEYVRHTLQDLKTLTRGLAAANHRLSHAGVEWKADLGQRLTVARVYLDWNFSFDEDILLTVVQWSALTRVMRELVSNIISHAQARRVEIVFSLDADQLELRITDDGVGRNPQAWSHGLGLGGVRKRVKQLGGEVEWSEVDPRGISCRVTIRDFTSRH